MGSSGDRRAVGDQAHVEDAEASDVDLVAVLELGQLDAVAVAEHAVEAAVVEDARSVGVAVDERVAAGRWGRRSGCEPRGCGRCGSNPPAAARRVRARRPRRRGSRPGGRGLRARPRASPAAPPDRGERGWVALAEQRRALESESAALGASRYRVTFVKRYREATGVAAEGPGACQGPGAEGFHRRTLLGVGGSEDGNEPNSSSGTDWRYLRAFRRDSARHMEDCRLMPRKGPVCQTSQRCSCAAASGAPAARRVPRLPPHPARRRAPPRARLGPAALRALLRRPARREPPSRALRARARERAPAGRRAQGRLDRARALRRMARARAPGHRLHRHHRSPRADLRLRLRPRRPAGVHGPLHARLPARPREPGGIGAASRFQLKAPFAKEYAELQITEVDRPRRIVEEIRVGRRGRNRSLAVYDFSDEGHGVTRVELTTFSEPATPIDRIKELGAAGWVRRQTARRSSACA